MVLTNFECWANVGSAGNISADIEHQQLSGVGNIGAGVAASRHVDLFNPRAVQQNLGQVPQVTSPNAGVSHISSNGYYGFSYVNAAHEMNNNNDNINTNNNNNDTICNNFNNNNNNTNMCNHNLNVAAVRCKKRFFVNDDDDLIANIAARCNPAAAVVDSEPVHGHFAAEPTVAKRCRYDDDFAAQYFNDFFNMQAATAAPTQIGTMSCLMDTEDFNQQQQQHQLQYELPLPPHHTEQKQQQQLHHQQQQQSAPQQQVDVAMAATSLHTNYAPSNAYHSLHQQQEQQPLVQQQQQQQQQAHFQDDVECNLSATDSVKGNNNKLVINSNKKSVQAASYMPNKNIGKLSTHAAVATATATEINESNQLLQTNATVETLFATTHGGSQYHCWQCCNYNNSNKNFMYDKPSTADNEHFYEEF